jgi:hypothetical protein
MGVITQGPTCTSNLQKRERCTRLCEKSMLLVAELAHGKGRSTLERNWQVSTRQHKADDALDRPHADVSISFAFELSHNGRTYSNARMYSACIGIGCDIARYGREDGGCAKQPATDGCGHVAAGCLIFCAHDLG